MRLNIQSAALRMTALALVGLMVVLIWGGIRAIARDDTSPALQTPSLQQPAKANTLPQTQFPTLPTTRAGKRPASTINKSPSPPSKIAAAKGSKGATPASPTAAVGPATRPIPSSPARPVPLPSPPPSPLPSPKMTPIDPAELILPTVGAAPRQEAAPADVTNFGDRYARDIFGKPVNNALLVVLHETVGSADSAINTMQTPHPKEEDQVSYHSIIRNNGTIVYLVPPQKRAFGAGNSVFQGANGPEAVKTHPNYPPSVNNFAYHISLESPTDGFNQNPSHSGYSNAQYQSLAWVIAWTNVAHDRITTHRAIDQSGSRMDPRSFEAPKLMAYLQQYRSSTATNPAPDME